VGGRSRIESSGGKKKIDDTISESLSGKEVVERKREWGREGGGVWNED